MKIVVIGGTGLIGSKLVGKLTEQGHEAVPATPAAGVNTVTGAGLAEVLTPARDIMSRCPSSGPNAWAKAVTSAPRSRRRS